jgi:rod shape-determining protein MreC
MIEAQQPSRIKLFLNIAVLALSLYGVSQKDYTLGSATLFDRLMVAVFGPVQQSIVSTRRSVRDFFDHYVMLVGASHENLRLKSEIEELQQKIFISSEKEKENLRLKELLDFGTAPALKKIIAQVVAWDASSDFRVIRVNKGLDDGVELNSTTITSVGLVGHVYRATNHFSEILTILDRNNRVDVVVDRTRSFGIVEGYSSTQCLMKYVARADPLQEGDVVLTAGLGDVYPKGIRVGTISKIEKESHGVTQYVEVTPSVDFGKLEEVIILVSLEDASRKKELKHLQETSSLQEK